MDPKAINRALSRDLEGVAFQAPITHAYDPLKYAWEPFEAYLERFGRKRPREVLVVGMNPGPWGMAQNGIPFGAMNYVRRWLGLEGQVDQPERVHDKRPVMGFECERNEVSGSRLWGWAEERFGEAEAFFERFFVHNFCPLLILDEDGKNRTPPKLRKAEREQVFPPCQQALRRLVAYFEPSYVVGVGNYAERQVKASLDGVEGSYEIGKVLHPSPASPKANRGWAPQAEEQLRELGIKLPR